MKPAFVLKLADILIQLVLPVCFHIRGTNAEIFFNACGVTLLWQFVSSIIHFFVRADWKKKSLRTLFVSLLLVSTVLAIVMWATFVLAFVSILLALFCIPILVGLYLIISIGELKAIHNEIKYPDQIDHIHPY